MTKEEMAKQIPQGFYCNGTDFHCPWFRHVETVKLHRLPVPEGYVLCKWSDRCDSSCWSDESSSCHYEVIRCEYLNMTDRTEKSHLWDAVKECGINDDIKEEDQHNE